MAIAWVVLCTKAAGLDDAPRQVAGKIERFAETHGGGSCRWIAGLILRCGRAQ